MKILVQTLKRHSSHFALALIFFFSVLSENSSAQFFAEKYSHPWGVVSTGNCLTSDGHILNTGGIETSSATIIGKILLMKTDLTGSVSWVKKYYLPGTTFNYGFDVTEMADNNYLLLGKCYFDATSIQYLALVKTDTSGNVLWQKYFAAYTIVKMVLDRNDNIYLLYMTGAPTGSFTVSKLDLNGDSLWSNTFSAPNIVSDGGTDMVVTNTDEILVTSNMFCNTGCQNVLWTKLDTNGNQIWTKGIDMLASPKVASGIDGYYVLIPDGNIIKTDTAGNPIWTKSLSSTEIHSLETDSAGGLFTVGRYYNATGSDAILSHIDANGTLTDCKLYSDGSQSSFTDLSLSGNQLIMSGYAGSIVNAENVFIVAEDFNGNCGRDTVIPFDTTNYTVYSFPLNQSLFSPVYYTDTIIIESDSLIDSIVCVPVNSVYTISSKKENYIYPNPAFGKITIVAESGTRISVYNLTGQSVMEIHSFHQEEIDLGNLPSGLYTVRIQTENNIYSKKLMLLSGN